MILTIISKHFLAVLFFSWWLLGAMVGSLVVAATIYLLVGYQNAELKGNDDPLDYILNAVLWPMAMDRDLKIPFVTKVERAIDAFSKDE